MQAAGDWHLSILTPSTCSMAGAAPSRTGLRALHRLESTTSRDPHPRRLPADPVAHLSIDVIDVYVDGSDGDGDGRSATPF